VTDKSIQKTENKKGEVIWTRPTPSGYLSFILTISITSALFVYLDYVYLGTVLLSAGLLAACIFYFSDILIIENGRIKRVGSIAAFWLKISGGRDRLRLSKIEQIKTDFIRVIRIGQEARFTYGTLIYGRNTAFYIDSRRKNYWKFINHLTQVIPWQLQDELTRAIGQFSIDKRSPKDLINELRLPEKELSDFSEAIRSINLNLAIEKKGLTSTESEELRKAAVRLRIGGLIPQSLEALRRLISSGSYNADTLVEYSRSLKIYAMLAGEVKTARRAVAIARLAERRAANDLAALERVGELYSDFDEWNKAKRVFRKLINDRARSFKAHVRLAEAALGEGKLAHVIHNLSQAVDSASLPELRRWAKTEYQYFTRLYEDEDYTELELSRISLLERAEWVHRRSPILIISGLALIGIGLIYDSSSAANAGWVIVFIALAIWNLSSIATKALSRRLR
jgi:tetratricopeptide (TPR) repeat protein